MTICGDAGNDSISGNNGHDTIDASYVVDNGVTLIGGAGTDTVVPSGGTDIVVNV